jgi:outer membrane receptor protein involved in Fe transport
MRLKTLSMHSSILALAAALAAPAFAQSQPAPNAPAPAQRAQEKGSRPAPEGRQQEVVVTGTRSDVIATPDRVSFSVANDLQVQTGTVADALRSVPGVEVDLQGNVSLRGDSGVKILIDGRPSAMMNGDSRGDVLLSMPAGRIERVEVLSNGSAALSPEGSGGIINLVTKQARKDSSMGTVRPTLGGEGRGGLNLSGTHSGNGLTLTGDLGYRRMTGEANAVQLRSRRDPATGAFVDSRLESELENANQAGNARLGIEYDLDKKNRLSTEVSYREIASDVERTESFAGPNPATSYGRLSDIDVSQRGFSARTSWRHTAGKDHEFVADAELEGGKLRREVEAQTDFTSAPTSSFERIRNAGNRSEYNLKLDYKRPTGKEQSLNLGYLANMSEADFHFSGNRGAGLDSLFPVLGLTNEFDYQQTVHALYGTYRFKLGSLDTQPGLRLEKVDTTLDQITDDVSVENDYLRLYPTLHLGYELSKTDQLRGSYSRRIQRPSPPDLNPYTFYIDPQNLRRGNPNLLPEITDSLELGWQHRKSGKFYSLTAFHRRSRGGVTDIISDLGDGIFLTTRANLASADRTGVEAVANGKLSKTLSYNGSATFVWTELDSRSSAFPARRSGATASARANLSWQPTKKDFFQLNSFYGGKQLLPQGYRRSGAVLNLGYRRKVNERLSLLVTGQDVLDSAKQVIVFDTPTLRDRVRQTGTGRMILFGLTYNLGVQGNRRRPEPSFEFQQGAPEVPQ